MPHTAAAQLIAAHLPTGLPHPGRADTNTPPTLIQLPGFKTTGLPPEITQAISTTAHVLAEAIINLLEANHYRITDAPPPTPDLPGDNPIAIHCNQCSNMLFALTDNGRVNTAQFMDAVKRINPDCPHT